VKPPPEKGSQRCRTERSTLAPDVPTQIWPQPFGRAATEGFSFPMRSAPARVGLLHAGFRGEWITPKSTMKFRRILVPTDFSDRSLRALDYAIDFARPSNAELRIIHVVEPIRHTRLISDVSELLENRRTEAAEELAKLEKETKQRYRNCRSEVHFGVPFEVIANVAKKSEADLVIIATHGHTGLSHMFLGSVAERVVRVAQCPVLTVRVAEGSRRRRPSHRTTKSPHPKRPR
jgi:universal stress protein A